MLKTMLVVLTVFIFAAASMCQTASPPDWQKINADNLFSFCLPKGFVKTDMMGVENYLGEYYKGKTRFLFVWHDTDSDAYETRRQPEMQDYTETETTTATRQANIRTFSVTKNGEKIYRAELNVGDWKNGEVELYMGLESENAADVETAKQIFNSIRFARK